MIVAAVRAGLPYKYAAQKAGVTERSVMRWLKEGRQATTNTAERQLCQRVEKAQAAVVEERIKSIGRQGKRNWKAQAWLLGVFDPDHFSPDRRELVAMKKELAAIRDELRASGAGRTETRVPGNTASGSAGGTGSVQPPNP